MPEKVIYRQDLPDGKELVVIRSGSNGVTDYASCHTLRLEIRETVNNVSVRVQSMILPNGIEILKAILKVPPPSPADQPKIYHCENCGERINAPQLNYNDALCFNCAPPQCTQCGASMTEQDWYEFSGVCFICA